eukprot:366345-Chlamydomonas_euryale.AAC.10
MERVGTRGAGGQLARVAPPPPGELLLPGTISAGFLETKPPCVRASACVVTRGGCDNGFVGAWAGAAARGREELRGVGEGAGCGD